MSEETSPSAKPPLESPGTRRPTVVGIGASAGGLQALKKFFDAVPRDGGLAYVVVVHLPADRESHLAELVQPHASLPVTQVTETTPLEPNHVYVIPPGHNLSAVDSHLRLTRVKDHRADRAPIDHFFRTLAESFDGRAVAVILTGTGSDGAQGVRRIREKGGVVIAQDPAEAEFDGMPRSAIESGAVDIVLPLAEIPRRIVELEATRPRMSAAAPAASAAEAERELVPRMLTQVRARTGHDFSRYKRSTIERRVERRMQVRGVEQASDYLEVLRANPEETVALADDLLINVTSFFRDRTVFEYLEQSVIPTLFEGKTQANHVRVWSVGCATGEEAYSLGMLLLEEAARHERPPQIQIFASDLHERSLRYAREGLYPETVAAEVTPERLERFFQPENGGYRVRKELRERVVFAPHNLLSDPPFSHLDLIACRNVMIYLQRDVQDEVVKLFHYALHGEGCLLLGTAESVDHSDLFRVESKENHVYRRRNIARGELRLPSMLLASPASPRALANPPVPLVAPPASGFGALHQLMAEQHAPPSVLVDAEHNVLHVSEHASRYLQVPGGLPSNSVFKLVREELRSELRAQLLLARERHATSRSKPIPVHIDGQTRSVVLRVSPTGTRETEGLALIIFDETGETAPVESEPGASTGDVAVRELETELEMTRGRLQALIEEFESSQEEMRASNEELQSANEELRSTMEELETSREELQSINEELQTVNQENRHKVEELSQLSADLQNLLRATDIGTLFLDHALRINRFTPRVGELFNIRLSDRGRPLADLTHRLGYGGLLEDARRVLETLVPAEREVETENGHWYLIRVLPYRTVDERIEGVVITLVDVTRLKRVEAAMQASEARYRTLSENLRDYAIYLLDANGVITEPTAGAQRVNGYSADEVLGQSVAIFYTPEAVAAGEPKQELDEAAARGRTEREGWRVRKGGERFLANEITTAVRDEAGRLTGFTRISRDLTERMRAVGAHEQLRRRLLEAEEAERRRLARELHDEAGQHLTALGLGLQSLSDVVSPGSEADQRAEKLRALVATMSRELHALAVRLRPKALDDFGLEQALSAYAEEWSRQTGVPVDVHAGPEPDRLPSALESALYRIVQEALTNVAKHSGATHASVLVERRNGQVVAIVEDNGRGFDSTTAPAGDREGLGLIGIRERAELLGGTVEVESTPGGGTTVFARIPIEISSGGNGGA